MTKLIVLIVLSIAVFVASRGLVRTVEKDRIQRVKQTDQARVDAILGKPI